MGQDEAVRRNLHLHQDLKFLEETCMAADHPPHKETSDLMMIVKEAGVVVHGLDDDDDDDSSPPSSPSRFSQNGPLYEFSDLIAKLPIKRGLSKYYDGKSQSFTSLATVTCLEDLAKKEHPYNRRMKLFRTYHTQKFCTPKPTIAKKATASSPSSSRTSCLSAMAAAGRNSDLFSSCSRPHTIPLQKQN